MDEAHARKLLGTTIREGDALRDGVPWVEWQPGDDAILLDGSFSLGELEAIAWWMRNKDRP